MNWMGTPIGSLVGLTNGVPTIEYQGIVVVEVVLLYTNGAL